MVCDRPLQNIYLYGSGDSWSAALGATGTFIELCKLHTIALPSLTASRYAPNYGMTKPESTLVIGISNSGRMARGVEATMAMAQCGYRPILLTGNQNSKGAKAADEVFLAHVPPFDSVPVPGVRSCIAAELALFLLAVHLAARFHTISVEQENELESFLLDYPVRLKKSLDQNRAVLSTFGTFCAEKQHVEFLSFGPSKAAGDFGMAKTYESTGYHAYSIDLEEFAHMNFFAIHPDQIPTVLIASGNARGIERAKEIEQSIRYQNRPYIVVTDGNEFLADSNHTIRVPYQLRECFAPLDFCFLMGCLTAYIPLIPGDSYMHRHEGVYFEGPFAAGEGFPTIMNSKFVL